MAQGEFTAEEAKASKDSVNEMFEAIPKSKRLEYIGHLNDILSLSAAGKAAAEKEKVK